MAFYIADAHCDFLYGMINRGYTLDHRQPNQAVHLPRMIEGGVAIQFFEALLVSMMKTTFLQQFITMADAYYRMLEEHADILTPFFADFLPGEGKIAAVLTIEGGEAIEGRLSNLRIFRKLGVRAITLTWNEKNELAYPAIGRKNKGLTRLGKDVVREMNRLNIALDVAHLNDAGIDDALALSNKPIFASHSNARAVYDNPRSLSDAHILAIAEKGGVIGVNFYDKQLGPDRPVSSDDVRRHIDHIVSIGGVKCAAIGSDFDGMSVYPLDLKHSADMPNLINALLRSGYREEDVSRIAYDNLRDYIVQFEEEAPTYGSGQIEENAQDN